MKPVAAGSFAHAVQEGLDRQGQKELPSKYLYDEIGTALFDAITLLPEYGLTRADDRLLRQHAADVVARLKAPVIVAELGSGNGKKARSILEALAHRHPTTYYPIEISRAALLTCEHELDHLKRVSILGFEAEYLDGLRMAAARRRTDERLLVLFLGSSIGNFDTAPAERFLASIRSILSPDDAMLLSADLVKPTVRMVRAYDDPAGVTAAFNLNLLARINRQLQADFHLRNFRHQAIYNSPQRRIEMHIVSTARQAVMIRGARLALEFKRGETIWTESSYKYTSKGIVRMAARAGFKVESQWVDSEWPFALSLLIPS
ncbi:MAG: L-histidine N(alpha)-methyltransferase [Acidobacteriota bacterium]|nr:L-histidine N(alpha)-methyltransferase [Acidobacteriota bacterium]